MKLLKVGLGVLNFDKQSSSQRKKMGQLISTFCGAKPSKRSPKGLINAEEEDQDIPGLVNQDDGHEDKSISSSYLIDEEESTEMETCTYSSMKQYQTKMAYQMFLEEQKGLSEDDPETLCSGECSFSLGRNQHGNNGLSIKIAMTRQFLNRYLSEKSQIMEQNPFFRDQTMVLMIGEEVRWYGYVENIYAKPANKESRNDLKILTIFVKIYDWDRKFYPSKAALKSLKILPCSTGTSRAFKAISEISNPKIVQMILGTSTIKGKNSNEEFEFSQPNLNDSQKKAIISALNNPITILQGPPGTGKTHIITEMVTQLLKREIYPILVVASSNTAVDNIAEKLMPNHGDSILRVVAGTRESKYGKNHDLNPICLHRKIQNEMPPHILALMAKLADPSKFITNSEHKAVMNVRNPATDRIVNQSKIILATTVVVGGPQFKNITKMAAVIMDEATQSPEYSSLIPLAFPGIEKILLVGDQKQLSGHAEVQSLAVSLFERVIANQTYKPTIMLDIQYRMHPEISKFPRNKIYRGLLKDGITASDRAIPGIPSNPVLFWDTQGKHPEAFAIEESKDAKNYSYCNIGEAEFVTGVLVHLINEKKIKKSNIGIIAPYGGQRSYISSIIANDERINPGLKKFQVEGDFEALNRNKSATIHIVSGITVASIDAFQGREKDFIIMSCVRSNEENNIGFLRDERRLNVAITRAKYGLIFIGDVKCLRKGNVLWKSFIDYMETKKLVLRNDDFVYG